MAKRDLLGPILFLRGYEPGALHLAALVVVRHGTPAPGKLETAWGRVAAEPILDRHDHEVLRYRFTLPTERGAWYMLGGERYEVDADWSGDLRLAFVSCNGQEHGDLDRPEDTRNALWLRMARQHLDAPINLLLQGGDQLYADEVTAAHPLSADWPETIPAAVPSDRQEELRSTLSDAFFDRYLEQISQAGFSWISARAPMLSMWDDHDICDGWGSLPVEKLDSDVGRAIFSAARELFLVFQFGAAPDEVPPICIDRSGRSLTWSVALPGLHVMAPDLRSERRPDRVMGDRGWQALDAALADAEGERMVVLSSVPALGPRLSLVETAMSATPWAEAYEDDLRDQWQSRAHRGEWRRFLRALMAPHERDGTSVTVLSGEIHLATRATMAAEAGPIHQLVSSGIAHPPPPTAYARCLGLLARLGEAPLKAHPIRLHPLPGRRGIYTNERNYLILNRNGATWSATWELEDGGPTPALSI